MVDMFTFRSINSFNYNEVNQMEVKNEYGKSQVVVLNVGQDDVDGMLINWDLTDDGNYDYME